MTGGTTESLEVVTRRRRGRNVTLPWSAIPGEFIIGHAWHVPRRGVALGAIRMHLDNEK